LEGGRIEMWEGKMVVLQVTKTRSVLRRGKDEK
jgi:hypothetical protein